MVSGWAANVMQQTTIRAHVKLSFAVRARDTRMAEAVNASDSTDEQMLGELWTYARARPAPRVVRRRGRRVRLGERRVVLRRTPVPRPASDAAEVVPPGERDPEAPRLAQPARDTDRGRARRSGPRAARSTATSRGPARSPTPSASGCSGPRGTSSACALGGRNELYERFYLSDSFQVTALACDDRRQVPAGDSRRAVPARLINGGSANDGSGAERVKPRQRGNPRRPPPVPRTSTASAAARTSRSKQFEHIVTERGVQLQSRRS